MRLHVALECIQAGRYRSFEEWKPGETQRIADYILSISERIAEFSFSFDAPDKLDQTLQVFIDFSNDLWDANIAPIPHEHFWLSWDQKLQGTVCQLGAFCERITKEDGKTTAGMSINVMMANKYKDGIVFFNQRGLIQVGDHKRVVVSGAETEIAGLMTDNGFVVVAALLGALATPQAIRTDVPAPTPLNKSRAHKKRPLISPVTVIDVRASSLARSSQASEGGWSVRPHWRRGHIRKLQNGRMVPVSPSWVNAEGDVLPTATEYKIKI